MNNLVLGLNDRDDINLKLLFAKQWLIADGRLDSRSPLASLPFTTFSSNENRTEWAWKLFGLPPIDPYIPDATDWVYAPMETYIPVTKCPMAISLHDIQAFETDLAWSQTWQHRLFAYKWSLWVSKVLANCRVTLTVSEFSKQRMVALLGADPRKIAVIGNGVESAFFEIAKIDPASLTPPIEAPYVIIVGGLRLRKGADYVLAVAKILQQRKSDLQIVVAGESELEYVTAAREYSNIKLLGMVSDLELPELLRCASSLLFLSPYEGFGIPALEAMAAGIPTVVSDRASLPEVVGDAGIVVDPTIAAPIVDILNDLHHLPQLRSEYIQRGYHHAATYTWASCVQRLTDTFHTFA
jgi:glycosyltransferase involved in cell wall biosynthesis